MLRSDAKKLAFIGNASTSMIDSREDLRETSLDWEVETVKCNTWNFKLNKSNEEGSPLIGSGSEPNLISRGYEAQLLLKILDTLWGLTIINKQQISTQGWLLILLRSVIAPVALGSLRRSFSLQTFCNQLY